MALLQPDNHAKLSVPIQPGLTLLGSADAVKLGCPQIYHYFGDVRLNRTDTRDYRARITSGHFANITQAAVAHMLYLSLQTEAQNEPMLASDDDDSAAADTGTPDEQAPAAPAAPADEQAAQQESAADEPDTAEQPLDAHSAWAQLLMSFQFQ